MHFGVLASGQVVTTLTPITAEWFRDNWHKSFASLAARPPIGGPNGYAPDNINDRLMGCFGDDNWLEPLMAVDGPINGPKGNIFGLHDPVGIGRIRRLAQDAVAADNDHAADALLSAIRAVGDEVL
jgi:chitinase